MSYVNTAALDPIFWLHHANIDRLWSGWINRGDGRVNPTTNPLWMGQKFRFWNVLGDVEVSDDMALDTVSQLNYRYDNLPIFASPALASDQPTKAGGRPARMVAASPEGRVELGDKPISVKLELNADARAAIDAAARDVKGNPALVLLVDGIDFDKPPGESYSIYLNLPDDAKSDAARAPYFVENLTFFGMNAKEPGHGGGMHGQNELEFGITRVVRGLKALGRWDENRLTVTFVEAGSIPPGGNAPVRRPGVKAFFRRLRVMVR